MERVRPIGDGFQTGSDGGLKLRPDGRVRFGRRTGIELRHAGFAGFSIPRGPADSSTGHLLEMPANSLDECRQVEFHRCFFAESISGGLNVIMIHLAKIPNMKQRRDEKSPKTSKKGRENFLKKNLLKKKNRLKKFALTNLGKGSTSHSKTT